MRRHMIAALGLVALSGCDAAMVADTAETPDSGLPDPAVATCMSAVARQTGNGIVEPLSIESRLGGKTVTIGVGEERAPWQCRVDRSGAVVEVMSLTDEGAA